ncbi:sulfotransferase [Nocardioides xinjiangensis]|uniref:sulfotransferase n=1 Tax=Nocardioides xinjiangensis TaxID=2817376 RepID=UPI001B3086AA|nr:MULTISPECIES: sulfotransferase domain-containing protein [unclassified Nocardioides]
MGALVEEERLHPVDRARVAHAKHRWRRRHGVAPGSATPVYVVGLQRSGTNMVLRGLDRAPEIEVHNESDRRVFRRYQLRSDQAVIETIRRSRHPYVLFKPLCDSHRTAELLGLSGVRAGKAIWIFRDVDDRTRSSIAKFGDSGLEAVRQIIAGDGEEIWQGRRLGPETLTRLREFRAETLTRETAAALLWYARNSLYFDLGLDRRRDVFLLGYDHLVDEPDRVGRELCAFLGLPWRDELFSHVERRHPVHRPAHIDPAARAMCVAMRARLDQAALAPAWRDPEEADL